MTAAAMISAALFARERTGQGDLVSTSLFRQGAYTIGFDVNVALMWGCQSVSERGRRWATQPVTITRRAMVVGSGW